MKAETQCFLNGRFWGLLTLMALLLASPAFGQRYTTLTQYASGDGWSSDVFLTNQAAQTLTGVVVSFYGDNGAPLSVVTNLGTNSSFTLNLNPGASQVVRVTGAGSLRVGYVVVKAPTPGSVIVTEVFRYEQGGVVVAELGVPQLNRHHHYSFPAEVDTARGINTGLALANPTYDSTAAAAQTLIVNLIGANGALFRRALVPLGIGEHMAKYLNESVLFPGLDNFVGTVSVSGARNFGVLGLRQDKQAFGAVAVDYGSVLTPFVVSTPSLLEVESNNSAAQAQLLTASCLVNGTISNAGDLDYFTFNGRRGDVVSFMVDTQGTASPLDSILRLEKADATLVATSDQNGLYGQNDSFVHVVLPDDGQYYVRVSDYSSSGGASYSYKLHTMFPGGVIPAQPQISSLNPTSGTRGSSTTLIVQGTNLSGASGITFTPSTGITVSNIQQSMSSAPSAQVTTQVVCAGEEVTYSSTTGAAAADIQSMSPTQITAQVAIASDAPTGARQVTVTTPGGTSNALTFTVNPGGGANYDGTWTGSTGSGTISFTVTNNKIVSLTVTHSIPAGCCTLTKFSWSSGGGYSISGDSFNFTVSSSPGSVGFTFAGTFSSPTQASGTIVGNLQASATMPCCTGSFNLSWSANK